MQYSHIPMSSSAHPVATSFRAGDCNPGCKVPYQSGQSKTAWREAGYRREGLRRHTTGNAIDEGQNVPTRINHLGAPSRYRCVLRSSRRAALSSTLHGSGEACHFPFHGSLVFCSQHRREWRYKAQANAQRVGSALARRRNQTELGITKPGCGRQSLPPALLDATKPTCEVTGDPAPDPHPNPSNVKPMPA